MVPWRATDDGFVTPDVLDWYERFAAGRPAAIVVEATGIRDVPSGPLADIVALARQALADPDWFAKVRAGRGAEVRLCIYTNYCEALDQRHRQVTCELWDRDALDEPGVRLSADGRRRLVAPRWSARLKTIAW